MGERAEIQLNTVKQSLGLNLGRQFRMSTHAATESVRG